MLDIQLLRLRLRIEELISHHRTTYVLVTTIVLSLCIAAYLGLRIIKLHEEVAGTTISTHCISSVSEPAFDAEVRAQVGDFAPDGHVSVLAFPGETRTFIPVGVRTVLIRETTDGVQTVSTVFSPSGVQGEFDRDYAGITSIIRPTADPQLLLGFYHAELRSDPYVASQYQASIGLARSADGGLTWQRLGRFFGGGGTFDPTKITGVGQPSATIVKRGGQTYVYVYYVDWNDDVDAIHVLRAPLSSDGALGVISRYVGDTQGFVSGKSANSVRVIHPIGRQVYAALPAVSVVSRTNTLLMAYESADGFYAAISRDGVHWTVPNRFFCFEEPNHLRRFAGKGVYESYPTIMNALTGMTSVIDPYKVQLLYGKGRPHEPYVTTVDIGGGGVSR